MHLKGKEKYYDFYKISRDILKIIKREGISHLVIVNSIWAILLYKCLRNYTNRFILDIRDYKIEKKTIIQFLLKDIINRSYCTFISSEGFQDFLPPSQHIHVIHNLDTNHMKIRVAEKVPTDINKIKIGFVGYVRYDAPNRWLIKQLRNHSDTEIHYYGGFSRYCNFHKEKNLIGNNVFFHGPYNNDDKSEIYNDIDFINALYSQDYSSRIALPNRIYDAAYYKKPIIASKGSFCGKIVSKYDMGFEVDFNEPDFYSHLISYINNFNLIRFERGCNKFIEKIMEQQNSALNLIDKFI